MRQTGSRDGAALTATGSELNGAVRPRLGPAFASIALSVVLAVALACGARAAAPKNTAGPTLTGTPAVGDTLSCSQGTWSYYTARSYAWLRDGTPIAGQSSSTYVVQDADQGKTISCEVTAGRPTGEYLLAGLPTGSYTVGFYPFEASYAEQSVNGVSVTVGGLTGAINATLQPYHPVGGQISGRVTASAGGAPLSDIEVCADDADENVCSSTNAGGEYTIAELASGSYKVEFAVLASEYLLQDYTTEVTVTAPATTSQINAALVKGAKISGKVTAAVGSTALAGIEVCASESYCASTSASGEYTIVGLPTGSYTVQFASSSEIDEYAESEYEPRYYNGSALGAPLAGEATAISVTAGGTYSSYNVELEKGASISGTVTAAGGGALAGIEVCAYATDASRCVSTGGSGQYVLEGLPAGSYKVQFQSPEDEYVAQYYNGKATEAEATPVTVAAHSTNVLAVAVLQPLAHGAISGKVTAAQGGGAIEEASVCAFSGEIYFEQCATANAAGEYTIGGLPSASYEVTFQAPGEANYVEQTTQGISVSAPGVTGGVNAALASGGEISGSVTAAGGGALGEVTVCAYDSTVNVCTGTGTGTASAVSNAVSVPLPDNNFALTKAIRFEAKTDDVDFFFSIPGAGSLKWGLFFKNSDVGFADALGLGLPGAIVEPPAGEAAKTRKGKKPKKCKSGYTKHDGRCVVVLVPFASSSKAVTAGTVEVKVHPSSRAIRALKAGHTLHVSGSFTFQSTLGGIPVAHTESTVVHLPAKRKSKKAAKKK